MERLRVLFVDDDDTLRRVLGRELEELGFDVRACARAEEALAAAREEPPDVALLDLRLPGGDVLKLGQAVHREDEARDDT